MPPKFGTSGLRGLVTDLTQDLVQDHVRAFLSVCDTGGQVYVGMDLRASSPAIADWVAAAAAAQGVDVKMAGVLPTPALALAARGYGAIMVTGSHIPADRNGLKFYTPQGEITKQDEGAITAALGAPARHGPAGTIEPVDCTDSFVHRYTSAFGPALTDRKLAVYSHSAAGRDLLIRCLQDCGAEVIEIARSDAFIPVDTEAVDPATKARLAQWARDHGVDAIVSTDGDSDRPMLTDETGQIIPGDILGQITARFLGADCVVTPISSNSGVAQMGFAQVIKTQIGSPYVIDSMEFCSGKAVGFEANGGTLLGFTAQGPTGPIPPLMTRDSFLPILTALAAAKARPLSSLVADMPARFTAADRLQDVPQTAMHRFVERLKSDAPARAAFLATCHATEAALDLTDGPRMTCTDGRILHVRPSGNAPELRLYVEADSRDRAETTLQTGLAALRRALHS